MTQGLEKLDPSRMMLWTLNNNYLLVMYRPIQQPFQLNLHHLKKKEKSYSVLRFGLESIFLIVSCKLKPTIF